MSLTKPQLIEKTNVFVRENARRLITGRSFNELLLDFIETCFNDGSGGSSDLEVGVTPIVSGTSGRIFYQNSTNKISQSANLFFDEANGRLSIAQGSSPGARLDVRAQGALSSDIVFRNRNSANTLGLFEVRGDGSIGTNNGATDKTVFINSTGSPSNFILRNVLINSNDTGGYSRPFNVLINASDNTGSGVGGRTYINTDSTVATRVWIGNSGLSNSGGVYVGDNMILLGNNIATGTNAVTIGNNMAWPGGGDSVGMFAIGSNMSGIVNDHANAFVFGINRKDFIIGGGKGNLGVGGYNPTGRSETNTIFQISGTTPTTSIVDGFQQYSADITAGNAAPHFRTEGGNIIKLYTQNLPTTPTTAEIATLLSNLGFANLI